MGEGVEFADIDGHECCVHAEGVQSCPIRHIKEGVGWSACRRVDSRSIPLPVFGVRLSGPWSWSAMG